MTSHDTNPQNMDGFYESVRDTAYFLWKEAGEPQERSDEFWYRALDIHYRSRAYGIWMHKLETEGAAIGGEPIGDISDTGLTSDEAAALAEGIDHERDA